MMDKARIMAAMDRCGVDLTSDELDRLATAAIAALDKARGGGWRPIESAPKDGTPVLMVGIQSPHEMVQVIGPTIFTGYFDTIDQAWCSSGSLWDGPFYNPTHWQPLPTPPRDAFAEWIKPFEGEG